MCYQISAHTHSSSLSGFRFVVVAALQLDWTDRHMFTSSYLSKQFSRISFGFVVVRWPNSYPFSFSCHWLVCMWVTEKRSIDLIQEFDLFFCRFLSWISFVPAPVKQHFQFLIVLTSMPMPSHSHTIESVSVYVYVNWSLQRRADIGEKAKRVKHNDKLSADNKQNQFTRERKANELD